MANKANEGHRSTRNTIKSFITSHATQLITIALVLLVLRVFIPQLSNLKESLQAVKTADIAILIEAVLIFTLGFPVVALKYCLIAQYAVKYWLTLQVQIASAFISKLLPMSIGSLTVNTFYLTTVSKDVAKAASTMTLNAVTSSTAFFLIIIFALIRSRGDLANQAVQHNIQWGQVFALFVGITLIIFFVLRIHKIRTRLVKTWNGLWGNFKHYKDQPGKVAYGVVFNAIGSLTGIATLYLCAQAVNLDITFSQAILSYTMGNIIGSLVPTPGGLGGAEAGLYAGLVFFGYDPSLCLTAVLIYRLISYWLPIIPGYLMYRHLRHTTLSEFSIRKKADKSKQKFAAKT